MSRRIISALLVFLLLTSVTIPTATAEPFGVVGVGIAAAAPETAEVVIAGITAVLSGAVIIEIGKNIGKTWDGVAENWDNFVKGVSKELDKLFHAKQWIKVTEPEGKAVMRVVYECWNAGGSSGGKKNDKWYFETRKHSGRLEINPEAMTEEQALKEMNRGKNIMTVNRGLGTRLINRFNGDPVNNEIDFTKHHGGKEAFFEHANFWAKNQRCHVWIWRP